MDGLFCSLGLGYALYVVPFGYLKSWLGKFDFLSDVSNYRKPAEIVQQMCEFGELGRTETIQKLHSVSVAGV